MSLPKPFYENANGKLYHGDCLDVMGHLEPVDLVVTSPPYDNLRNYDGYIFNFYRTAWMIKSVLREGAVCVWVVSDETKNGSESGTSFRQALFFKAIGLNLHDTMVWNKGAFTSPQMVRYPNTFEYMFILSKSTPVCHQIKDRVNVKAGSSSTHTIRKPDGETKNMYSDCRKIKIGSFGVRFNIWNISTEQSNKNRVHPAQFPEQLPHDHIISWSNEGDTVLDPMCGSGTTCKKAERLGRKWIGIEISEKYCEIAAKRIESEYAQRKLFA